MVIAVSFRLRAAAEHRLGHAFGGAQRGAGHDVEVAGVGRQVVRGAFHLQEDRGLQAVHAARRRGCASAVGVDAVELHLLLEPVARHIGLHVGGHALDADAAIASSSAKSLRV